jgi:hypothetical protein
MIIVDFLRPLIQKLEDQPMILKTRIKVELTQIAAHTAPRGTISDGSDP